MSCLTIQRVLRGVYRGVIGLSTLLFECWDNSYLESLWYFYCTVQITFRFVHYNSPRARNLRQGIVIKPYFCFGISFCLVSSFSIFFESIKSKSTQMLRPQKGNSRVLFSDSQAGRYSGLYTWEVSRWVDIENYIPGKSPGG